MIADYYSSTCIKQCYYGKDMASQMRVNISDWVNDPEAPEIPPYTGEGP